MKYIIIGNSAAAIGTVEAIRRIDADGELIIISDEPYHTYSRPLISYYLAGKVSEEKMHYRDLDFYEKNRVTKKFGVRVEDILPAEKKVLLADGEQISYDKLLIATGGTPFIPPLKGGDKKGVYTFIKFDDVKNISEELNEVKNILIIGAGLIGLKAAEGLASEERKITVVELAERILPAILDEQASKLVQKHLEKKGISFNLGTSVSELRGEERVSSALLADGEELPADLVVVAVGVRPNTSCLGCAEIKINRGILIDEYCRTSDPDIYAAGDVSEGFDMLFQEQRVLPILPNAYRQGEAAGLNMAGKETVFKGGFAMNSIGFFGLPMITAGIIKPEGDEYFQESCLDEEKKIYRKLVIKDNRIKGFILLNDIDRAGILTGMMNEEIDVSPFLDKFIEGDFSYANLPKDLRDRRLQKGGK